MQDSPLVKNARASWEKDEWDREAKAWRETIDWESKEVNKSVQAIEDYNRAHPCQSLALR